MNRMPMLCLIAFTALNCDAQTEALDGAWVAKWNAPNGTGREAKVAIKGEQGTWKMATSRMNREDPCNGNPIPFDVSKSDEGVAFAMSPSKGMAGCGQDYTLKMKKVDDKTMEGSFRDGRTFTVTRQ
ncbi:hypothetical protein [Variovorax sp. YR216]|uniref:hypothetical protein n=1 Tax=Variovorax sp. YR216 TaxID=1882828 RepID=UPI00089CC993|nr:hypothetical protein [Variovorax sp. YR216]SEB06656.1 hypothetical protein SAMN05444680_106264 [Variovorax sp. YR216]